MSMAFYRGISFGALITIFFFGAHLIWSLLISLTLTDVHSHRISHIGKYKEPDDWELASNAFFKESMNAARTQSKPLLLFTGSSVTYGYAWQESVIFTKVVQRLLPDTHVSNLSFIGGSSRSLTDFPLCSLSKIGKPHILVAEIPLLNTLHDIKRGPTRSRRQCADQSRTGEGYFSHVLMRPIGTGWIKIAWNEHSYHKNEQELTLSRVPDRYFIDQASFEMIRKNFAIEVSEYLAIIGELSDIVYVFVSPIYLAGATQLGADADALQQQIKLSNDLCKMNKKLKCLDTDHFMLQAEYFYNVSHFNQRGNMAFGKWMAQQIAPDVPRPAPSRSPAF